MPPRPLGLKESKRVPGDVLERLSYIEGFRLDLGERADATLERELKRFFALPVIFPGEHEHPFVPSLAIDDLWHQFLVNTPRYHEFCHQVYGEYLHHVPGETREETERRVYAGPMKFTVDSLRDAFDDVDENCWAAAAFCGPCLFQMPRR